MDQVRNDPLPEGVGPAVHSNTAGKNRMPQHVAAAFGLLAGIIGLLGLLGLIFHISFLSSIITGYQPMAFGTSLILILLGTILALVALQPSGNRPSSVQLAAFGVILAVIAIAGLFELLFSVAGGLGIFIATLVRIGNSLAGGPTAAISPGTLVFVIAASTAIFLLVIARDKGPAWIRHAAGLLGAAVALGGFTFVISYAYRDPLMYGTDFVPIALPTAIAICFLGIGITTAAGRSAFPLALFAGLNTYSRSALASGLLAAGSALLGLVQIAVPVPAFAGFRIISVSAAAVWIAFGLVIAYHAASPLKGWIAAVMSAAVLAVAILEAVEIPVSLAGSHTVVEQWAYQIGTALLGPMSMPISPVASALICSSGIGLAFLFIPLPGRARQELARDMAGAIGSAVALVAFTFLLGMIYGSPLLHDTTVIPIAPFSALAGIFTGTGLVALAGARSFPLKYFSGNTTRARLLRIFVPLAVILAFVQNAAFTVLTGIFDVQNAILFSACLIVFIAATAWVVGRYAQSIGTDLEQAEEKLTLMNEELYATNEELTATAQDLLAANDELARNERALRGREADLARKNEELTATGEELRQSNDELAKNDQSMKEALAEKEILLSEIHHRVKNNLAAFISLLSLEGSYDDSPAGLALKKDLQNRARSMALIHETLYRTRNFSKVDMKIYLSTLVEQVVNSYESAKLVKTIIEADNTTLDLARATPAGLIVNELVTNSLKYAFPASYDCEKVRGSVCCIRISLVKNDGVFTMTVRDNGVGLPKGFDPASSKTLGLKLVNFLARYQMKANIEINTDEGTEFGFVFRDDGK
ncbi:MAG TPA: histidine kinase dimerization/phosphoacceptor domain -containing protein [Methanoregulaceae archaeon]|nr:histidine kinase dimerization/phosphoacceptor domain -containing protein [Methanoregulaceae archaeon]